jgi:hypothetical protein
MYCHHLLFREEPSIELELEGECDDTQTAVEGDDEKEGWDRLVNDLGDDEGFVDEDNDVFILDI